jgi:hypothetical protein
MCCSQPTPPRKRGTFTLIVAIASALAGAGSYSRMNTKHQALDLEAYRRTLDDLGRALHEGPWVTASDLIARERSALGELHSRIGDLIGRNEAGIAPSELAALQIGIARLSARNVLAQRAAPSRERLLQARRGLTPTTLLQADNESDFGALARDAEQAWNVGEFETAQRLYEIAYERGGQWLKANNALRDELSSWRQADGADALIKALSATSAQLKDLNSRFQAASLELEHSRSEIADLNKQYQSAQGASAAVAESYERKLKTAEAFVAASERSLTIALVQLKENNDSFLGARAEAADLRAGLASITKALDSERMARATAETGRDEAFRDGRAKAQELAAREQDLSGMRTRCSAAEKTAVQLSHAVFGLRSQIHDLDAVLVTTKGQKEKLETELKVLQAAHAQGTGERSPNHPFTLGGRNPINRINLGRANPYARFSDDGRAVTARNP